MNALQFECIKVALKQDRNGYVLTLNIHPDEIPNELLRDFVGARYGVAMVRINDDESPIPVNNRVKTSGILCRDLHFQRFLEVTNEDEAVKKLYQLCDIRSRTELNNNPDAQSYFDELLKEYEEYKDSDPL